MNTATSNSSGAEWVLRAALREADPVPEQVLFAARHALAWRTIDAELAELAADSALEPVAVRSTECPSRVLTFSSGVGSVVLEVVPDGDRCTLVGQLDQAAHVDVEVRHAGGTATATSDAFGRFHVDGVPHGPVSLLCRSSATGTPFVTAWVRV